MGSGKSKFQSTAKKRPNESLYASFGNVSSAGIAKPQAIQADDRAGSYVSCFSFFFFETLAQTNVGTSRPKQLSSDNSNNSVQLISGTPVQDYRSALIWFEDSGPSADELFLIIS